MISEERIILRVSSKLKNEIIKIAELEEKTMSNYIRELIVKDLKEREEKRI